MADPTAPSEPDDATDNEDERLVRVGCAGLPPSIARTAYFERLDLLEVDATFFDPPGAVALRRWRAEAPANCAFSSLAWQLVTHEPDSPGYARLTHPLAGDARTRVGAFRDTPEVRDAWTRSVAAATALGSEVLLIDTPTSFTPSTSNKDALRRFVGEVVGDRGGLALAWEPHGIWEPNEAQALAEELDLVYALDPLQLEVPPPEEPAAYFRVHGLGIYRNKLSDDMLELLADMVSGYERAWVVFANVEKYRDAQRFHKLLAGREFVADEE